MNKKTLLIILMAVLGGIGAEAQRPVGDTVIMGSNSDYQYDALYIGSGNNAGYHPTMYGGRISYSNSVDLRWGYVCEDIRYSLLNEMSWDTLYKYYPELFTNSGGIHISGESFSATEDMLVVGLAVCPTIYTGPLNNIAHVVDTSIANRVTEYVQLYTFLNDGTPQLRAQGPWRWENPHRYMLFPNINYEGYVQSGETACVPLYETMFDTNVLIEIETGKPTNYMLAGTFNNNGVVWADTCYDTIFPQPKVCIEHYATSYSSYLGGFGAPLDGRFWTKYGSFPWYIGASGLFIDINIFPILDTLFGTPCAVVTGLQTVEVDSLWATLMWSADARQHEWEVAYRPADDSLGSDRVVTVTVPTVTLTGLTPGTAYSVRVRGLCDVENYSPWSDTLQFVTTFTPPDTTSDTLPWIHPWIHPHTLGIGNLDRFTRMMPNPAHDVVSVFSSYQLEGVTVYDLTGRQLIEQPAEGMTATVNVSALPRGTYILAIRTQQGVATKRLILK